MQKSHFSKWCGHLLSIILLLGLCAFFLGDTAMAAKSTEDDSGFEKIAETDQAILLVKRNDALLRVRSKVTGQAVDTKIMDGTKGNAVTQSTQKSDIVTNVFTDLKTGSATLYTNYDLSIQSGQLEYKEIADGVKINYILKQDKLNMDMFPKKIDRKKLEDLVMKYLTSAEKKKLKDSHYRLSGETYVRKKDDGVTNLNMKALYKQFYEKGKYTQADLEADNKQYAYVPKFKNMEIDISVEYTLDGGDLLVRVPMKECTVTGNAFLNTLSILPYMMSADNNEEGYFLVPDGAGAIINFNNGRTMATNYTSPIYGEDILMNAGFYKSQREKINMPIIGAKFENYGMLAILEKGGSLAEINTEISNKSDDHNKAYFTFNLKEMEKVPTTFEGSVFTTKYTDGTYNDDIMIRYKFLEKDKSDYNGMAKAYQEYLISKGILTKTEKAKDASLFLETVGTLPKKKLFLGIPYDSYDSMTTFEDAQNMLHDLKNMGVGNIQMQFTGWANKGVQNTAYSKLKIDSYAGGSKDFKELLSYAKENQFGFYPTMNLQSVYSTKNISARKAFSKFLSGDYAKKEYVIPDLSLSVIDDMYSPYLISPNYLTGYVNTALKKIGKYRLEGIAPADLGNTIVGDYGKRSINRETAKNTVAESLASINMNYNVLLNNPNDYSWAGADYIADIPIKSSQYNVFDYDVPFEQLVLDGCVPYSTENINVQPQKSLNEFMLTCIESRSNPKFLVMQEKEAELAQTLYLYLFSNNFGNWKDRIGSFYEEYNQFYQKVQNADIVKHEVQSRDLRKVTYSNGVVVYLNYGTAPITVDSKTIEAMSYLIEEGRQ